MSNPAQLTKCRFCVYECLEYIESCQGFQDRECLMCDEAGACVVDLYAKLQRASEDLKDGSDPDYALAKECAKIEDEAYGG